MMRVTLLILSVAIVFLLVLNIRSYNDSREIKDWANSIQNQYIKNNKELEDKVAHLESVLDKYYEDKITKLLGENELMPMAREQWKYSLTANDESFKEDYIYIGTKEVTLVFAENEPKEKLLPNSIHNKGALAGQDKLDKFYDHLIIECPVPYETKIKTEGNTTYAYYEFKDVPRGTIITLRLSEPLRERLNLPYNKLEVIVNRV